MFVRNYTTLTEPVLFKFRFFKFKVFWKGNIAIALNP